jgi:hypothetical protein
MIKTLGYRTLTHAHMIAFLHLPPASPPIAPVSQSVPRKMLFYTKRGFPSLSSHTHKIIVGKEKEGERDNKRERKSHGHPIHNACQCHSLANRQGLYYKCRRRKEEANNNHTQTTPCFFCNRHPTRQEKKERLRETKEALLSICHPPK